VFSLQQGFRA